MLGGLALVFAGCAHYTDQPLKPEQTAAALMNRSLADPELHDYLVKNLGHDLPCLLYTSRCV